VPKGRYRATDDIDLGGNHLVDWRHLEDIPMVDKFGHKALDGYAIVSDGSTWNIKPLTSGADGPLVVSWDDLADIPAEFTPGDHTHPLSDLEQSAANTNQVAKWNGTSWVPASIVNSVIAGTGIAVSGATGDVTISHNLSAGTGISIVGATISHAMTAGAGIDITGAAISVKSALTNNVKRLAIEVLVNGNGSVLTAGNKGYAVLPCACTLIEAIHILNLSDTMTWEIKSCSYSGYNGSLADITGGSNFGVTGANKNKDATLSGWTTDFAAEDVFKISILTAPSSATIATLVLIFEADIT